MQKIRYDYSKLRGLIVEKFSSLDNFAVNVPIGRTTLTNKLKSDTYFTQIEIEQISKVLDIDKKDRNTIFFTRK